MFSLEIETLARLLVDECQERRLRIVTAESCTGGLVSAALTSVAGSSAVFERGLIVYSNRAKQEMLDVPGDLIADYGAVSEPVARVMGEGELKRAHLGGDHGRGGAGRRPRAQACRARPLRHRAREPVGDAPRRAVR